MEAASKVVLDFEVLKPRIGIDNIFMIGTEPFSQKQCIGIVGVGGKMKIETAIANAFRGTIGIIKQIIPTMSDNMIKSLVTLIGNSFNGQAFSRTSESTSIIVITKEDVERITQSEYKNFSSDIERVMFEEVDR